MCEKEYKADPNDVEYEYVNSEEEPQKISGMCPECVNIARKTKILADLREGRLDPFSRRKYF
ncbi:MAG: hypothetical protein LBG80_18750 [Bacteroidales bacterium]|nr:hypothetical protein [Bacteroidales bacterium]